MLRGLEMSRGLPMAPAVTCECGNAWTYDMLCSHSSPLALLQHQSRGKEDEESSKEGSSDSGSSSPCGGGHSRRSSNNDDEQEEERRQEGGKAIYSGGSGQWEQQRRNGARLTATTAMRLAARNMQLYDLASTLPHASRSYLGLLDHYPERRLCPPQPRVQVRRRDVATCRPDLFAHRND